MRINFLALGTTLARKRMRANRLRLRASLDRKTGVLRLFPAAASTPKSRALDSVFTSIPNCASLAWMALANLGVEATITVFFLLKLRPAFLMSSPV